MPKIKLILFFSFLLITTGCARSPIGQQLPTTPEQEVTTVAPVAGQDTDKEKNISWCDKNLQLEKDAQKISEDENELWISSDYYSGMNHAPTVRHICRGSKELFYLQMDWDQTAALHAGKLITAHSSNTLSISSVNVDPEVELIENKNHLFSKQVLVLIDGKIVVFDETNNTFAWK